MPDQVTLLIKHAVSGRMLLDSRKTPVTYTLDLLENDGWKFSIHSMDRNTIDLILSLKDELNVFLFQEAEGQPIVKNWYYVNPGLVDYDDAGGCLNIGADSHITYLPSDYYA
jgi:hypothetical protein